MKNSTNSSTSASVTSASLRVGAGRCRRDGFGSAASLVGSSSGPPPMAVSSAAASPVFGSASRRAIGDFAVFTTTGKVMSWISR